MRTILNFPSVFSLLTLLGLYVSTRLGIYLQKRRRLNPDERDDYDQVVAATLTLLGLIIGYTFSMSINRYDLRKT
jgi:hypothetical protein